MKKKEDKKVENMVRLIRHIRKNGTPLRDTVLVVKDGKVKFEKKANLN